MKRTGMVAEMEDSTSATGAMIIVNRYDLETHWSQAVELLPVTNVDCNLTRKYQCKYQFN